MSISLFIEEIDSVATREPYTPLH